MIFLTLAAFFAALVSSTVLIRWASSHAAHYEDDKPQRFHAGAVPRLGGLGVLVGMLGAWAIAAWTTARGDALNAQLVWAVAAAWACVVLPAVLGGAYEDVTER